MKLLDFPPEVFGLIIHELVEAVGVVKAQEYLKVCSKLMPLICRRRVSQLTAHSLTLLTSSSYLFEGYHLRDLRLPASCCVPHKG